MLNQWKNLLGEIKCWLNGNKIYLNNKMRISKSVSRVVSLLIGLSHRVDRDELKWRRAGGLSWDVRRFRLSASVTRQSPHDLKTLRNEVYRWAVLHHDCNHCKEFPAIEWKHFLAFMLVVQKLEQCPDCDIWNEMSNHNRNYDWIEFHCSLNLMENVKVGIWSKYSLET